jgi:hypothetical protein
MQSTRTQPFSRFVNWFRLHVDGDNIYKFIPPTPESPAPENFFIEHDNEFYFLEEAPGCKQVTMVEGLKRRVIEHTFRDALEQAGFSFKGHGYIAYWNKTTYNKEHNDILVVAHIRVRA